MSMLGLDFLGPITPACSQTGARYVLIAIDYFSRFTWAGAYKFCTMTEVCYLLTQHIAPVFGWPKAIYTDNGSHFTGQEIRSIFDTHGVTHFTAPVTHPSSVGLVERNVQLMMSQIRKRSIDSGLSSPPWATFLTEATISINTRLMRVHGYSPANILMGYTPRLWHQQTATTTAVEEDEIKALPANQISIRNALRSEQSELAM